MFLCSAQQSSEMKLKLPKYIKEEDTVTSDDDQVENSADEESELIPASVVVVRPTTRALRSSSMVCNNIILLRGYLTSTYMSCGAESCLTKCSKCSKTRFKVARE